MHFSLKKTLSLFLYIIFIFSIAITSVSALGVGPAGANFNANTKILRQKGIIGKTNETITPPQQKIAYFCSTTDGTNITILLANTDGSDPVEMHQLDDIEGMIGIIGFRWSKEAQMFTLITYESHDGYLFPMPNFYLIENDLKELVDITPSKNVKYPLGWSPDGKKLAYISLELEESNFILYIYDRTTDTSIQITESPSIMFGDSFWSADGTKTAYSAAGSSYLKIYLADGEGENPQQLTTDENAPDMYPSWSPDGTKIVFQKGNINTNIYVIDLETKEERALTTDNRSMLPSWSPDGSKIAFFSPLDDPENPENPTAHIYVINSDGSDPTQLTTETCFTIALFDSPLWSPAGDKILFTGIDGDVCVVNADGTNLQQLVTHYEEKGFMLPIWVDDYNPNSAK